MSADDLLWCRRHPEHHDNVKIAAIQQVLASRGMVNSGYHVARLNASQCELSGQDKGIS